jgi:hypothetical protein
METTALIVIILAGLIHISAFLLYNHGILCKDKRPNIVTWFIWGSMSALNFLSYLALSQSIVVSLLSLTGAAMCSLTFLVVLFKRNFRRPRVNDLVALGLGMVAIAVWKLWDSATYANLIVLAGIAVGFFPTYRDVLQDPENEPSLPWYLWATAFTLGLAVALLKWEGNPAVLAYPVSMALMHLAVPLLGRMAAARRERNNER